MNLTKAALILITALVLAGCSDGKHCIPPVSIGGGDVACNLR